MLNLFGAVAEFIASVAEAIVCGMKSWFCWMVDLLIGGGMSILDGFLSLLPHGAVRGGQGGLPLDLNPLFVLVPAINAWFPLDYGVGLLAAYFTFSGGFIVVKLVLKLIPTIG